MKKLLLGLTILVLLSGILCAAWIFYGAQLSPLIDRYKTIETVSRPINALVYEGTGSGGVLRCDGLALSLNNSPPNPQPNVGTTKDNEIALSWNGKVFPFGAAQPGEALGCKKPDGDVTTLSIRHSIVSWPASLDLNFMSGKSSSWKRHIYRQLTWAKPTGAKLEMAWRYEQHFLPGDGWSDAQRTSETAPGLIRVDISPASR